MTSHAAAILALALASLCAAAERTPIGLTASGDTIDAFTVLGGTSAAPKLVLIGDTRAIRQEVLRYESLPDSRRRFDLLALVLPAAPLTFPPAGIAYRDNPESHYIWRWLGLQAPDLVIVAGDDPSGLVPALAQNAVAGVGRIPARTGTLASVKLPLPKSEAHLEMQRRLARSASQLAGQLERVYGQDFEQAVYIPAVALLARLRLGRLAEVETLARPFREGLKDSLAKATGSHLSGHLLFAALANETSDGRYITLVRRAADLALEEKLHNEMSDSVFMSCPLLAEAAKLTGDVRYLDGLDRHLKRMQQLCLRPDGLYRHSPLNDAAWGRGNAFPALGLALTLSVYPRDRPAYESMLRDFQNHIAALARAQDDNGMWRQVVDRPGSYSELSATAMITVAMLRGVRSGWLDPKAYSHRIDRAWKAVLARTAPDGRLIDVCESTGKQKTLDDYLRRAAILDRDPRGGAMVLLLATEMLAR